MGEAVRFTQTAVMNTGGTQTISYIHDPKGKASRVGIISAHLASGTQTGSVSIRYGNDVTNAVEIGNGTFTANDPSVTIHPNFVIHPGQAIVVIFSTVTAGDVARVFIGGH